MENDVAATARITASIRARETARPDALFRDPLAEVLAGHAAMAAMQAMPEAVRERSSMYTVIRTRVFDDWLLTTLGPGRGVAQVVLLGAGFDSRAFRLDWPPGVHLWELDQVSLLAAKEAILTRAAAIPGCQRSTLAVDFADAAWRTTVGRSPGSCARVIGGRTSAGSPPSPACLACRCRCSHSSSRAAPDRAPCPWRSACVAPTRTAALTNPLKH